MTVPVIAEGTVVVRIVKDVEAWPPGTTTTGGTTMEGLLLTNMM